MEGQENIIRADEQTGPDVIGEPEGSREYSGRYYDGRRIFRVPYHVRRGNEEDYIPKIVSFGPYYHGSNEIRLAEGLKPKIVEYFISESGRHRQFFYDKVFEVIHEIRLCYDGITKAKIDDRDERMVYNDTTLAEMIVQDTFFLIYLMKASLNEMKPNTSLILDNLGISGILMLCPDPFLLENQIPLSIINLFVSLIFDEDQAGSSPSLVLRYIVNVKRLEIHDTQFPVGRDGKQPLHVLDAYWRFYVAAKKPMEAQVQDRLHHQALNIADLARLNSRPFRSITDLRKKGIYFKCNGYPAIFQFRSWTFFGELRIPLMILNTNDKVILTNLIAFEVSPGGTRSLLLTSHINFIKSLVVSPKDVRELREKEILFSTQDNDEDVLNTIKGINTHGWDDPEILNQVKKEINEHCNSRMGTWMAELVYTYFRTPWTFFGLLAAIILLSLTLLQTYYAAVQTYYAAKSKSK